MKVITFKKLIIQNYLSIGNDPIEIEFKPGVNYITGNNLDVPGTTNASGKCLDKNTKIEIEADEEILNHFNAFNDNFPVALNKSND